MKKYSIIAFGEPLTEVLLHRPPNEQEFQNQSQMSLFLRSSSYHAASGDVLNFIGNYSSLFQLFGDKLPISNEPIGLLSAIGDDEFGRKIKSTLQLLSHQNIKVDAELLALVPYTKSGVYGVYVLDKTGRYQFFFDRFGYAFEHALSITSFNQILKTAEQSHFFYTTGIALMMTKEYQLFPKLFQLLSNQNTQIIFDTNYRKLVATHANIPNLSLFLSFLFPHVSLLFAGEEDVRNIYPKLSKLPTTKLVETFFSIVENTGLSKEKVIIKCGDQGVYWFDKILQHEPIVENNPTDCEDHMIHPEGAGDAFNAGFMFAHTQQKPLKISVQFGLQIASRMVRYKGCYRGVLPFQNESNIIFKCLNQTK